MKNRLIACLLLAILAGPSVFRFYFIADYFLNTGVIAQKHCINKAKPQLKCNGRCHLNSELKTLEDNRASEGIPAPALTEKDLVYCVLPELIAFSPMQLHANDISSRDAALPAPPMMDTEIPPPDSHI